MFLITFCYHTIQNPILGTYNFDFNYSLHLHNIIPSQLWLALILHPLLNLSKDFIRAQSESCYKSRLIFLMSIPKKRYTVQGYTDQTNAQNGTGDNTYMVTFRLTYK